MTKDSRLHPAPAEDLSGRTLALAGLVEVQGGAVVSRTIINRPTGTVTLFAFDGGQSLSEHSAPFDALLIGLEGEGEVSLDGKPHRLGAGEMIILPAGHPHALRAEAPFKMALVMIKS
jgi:quercetin dioxygenase-like cupin family protein